MSTQPKPIFDMSKATRLFDMSKAVPLGAPASGPGIEPRLEHSGFLGAEAEFPQGEPGKRIGPREIAAAGIIAAPVVGVGAEALGLGLFGRAALMGTYGTAVGAGQGAAAEHPSGRDILTSAASQGLLYGGGELGAGLVQRAFGFLRSLRGVRQASTAAATEAAAPVGEVAAKPSAAAPATRPVSTPTPVPSVPLPTPAGKPAGDIIGERLGILDKDPQRLMTSALKPSTKNFKWAQDMTSAFPDLKAAEVEMGQPIKTFDDAENAAKIAKKTLWDQFAQKLKMAGTPSLAQSSASETAGATAAIDGNKIADAMMASIDKRTALQNPALVKKITDVANTYRRPLGVEEAEEFLQSTNNELHSYYAKNKVGQAVAARDPETGHVVAEGNQLRRSLYSKLDELTGPGAADLKQRYGAVSNFQDTLVARKNVSLRQQPQSLAEQISKARAYAKIAVGIARADPWTVYEGVQQSTAATWLKERQTSEAMMERAFANWGRPTAQNVPPVVSVPRATGVVAGFRNVLGGPERGSENVAP